MNTSCRLIFYLLLFNGKKQNEKNPNTAVIEVPN